MNNGLLGFSELANASARNSLVTSTTSATNVVLSTTANQTQNISMSAAGLAVVLPSALQYPYGNNPVFLIRNTGTNVFDVQDSTGQTIFAGLTAYKSVIVWLRDNTTAAGSWSLLSNQAVQTILNGGTSTQVYAANTGGSVICQVNSTTAFLVATSSSGSPFLYVLNLSGAVVTVNAGVAIDANSGTNTLASSRMSICQVTTGQAVLVTQNGMAYSIQLAANNTSANISGGVPFGPTLSTGPFTIADVTVATASSTSVIITCQDSGNSIYSSVATVDSSNNICIMGVANSLNKYVATGNAKITNIGTNQLLVVYNDQSYNVYGYVLTGTAGVYTKGPTYNLAPGLVNNNPNFEIFVCYIGNNQAILTYPAVSTNNASAVVISITGTTLAANAVQTVVAASTLGLALCQTSTGNALMLCYNNSTTYQLYALSVTGTAITVGTPVTATGVASNAIGANVMCQTNTNKAALVYWNGTSSTFARVVSVSGTTITYNAASTAYSTLATTNPSLSICQTNTDQACIGAFWSSAGNWVASSVDTTAATAVITGTTQIGSNGSTNAGAAVAQSAATGAFVAYFTNAGVAANAWCAQGFTVASGSSAPVAGSQGYYWATGQQGNSADTFQMYGAYASPGYSVFIAGDNNYSPSAYTIGVASSGSSITTPTMNYSVGTGTSGLPIASAQSGVTGSVLIAWGTSNVSVRYATATGYTVAFGTAVTGYGAGATNPTSISIVYISTNYWLLVLNNGTAANGIRPLKVVGTTVNTAGNTLTSGVGTSVNTRGSIVASALNSGLVAVTYQNTTVSYSTQLLTVASLSAGSANPIALLSSALTTTTTSPDLFAQDTVGPAVIFVYRNNASSIKSQAIQYVKE